MDEKTLSNDNDLWHLASVGDQNAEEILLKKYYRLVRVCARPYFLAGGDSEDLIQEGMLGLLSAVRQYDPNRDTSFRTFSELCIKNRLITAIKTAARPKHSPLNDCVPLESSQFEESRTRSSYNMRNPEDLIIDKERTEELTAKLKCFLSQLESKVLVFYLEGLSYSEIAEQLGKSVKSVDNAVQRIRKKIAYSLINGELS